METLRPDAFDLLKNSGAVDVLRNAPACYRPNFTNQPSDSKGHWRFAGVGNLLLHRYDPWMEVTKLPYGIVLSLLEQLDVTCSCLIPTDTVINCSLCRSV